MVKERIDNEIWHQVRDEVVNIIGTSIMIEVMAHLEVQANSFGIQTWNQVRSQVRSQNHV